MLRLTFTTQLLSTFAARWNKNSLKSAIKRENKLLDSNLIGKAAVILREQFTKQEGLHVHCSLLHINGNRGNFILRKTSPYDDKFVAPLRSLPDNAPCM